MWDFTGLNARQIRLIGAYLSLEFLLRVLQRSYAFVERGIRRASGIRLQIARRYRCHAQEVRDLLFDALVRFLMQPLCFLELRFDFRQCRLFLPFGWIEIRRGEIFLAQQR